MAKLMHKDENYTGGGDTSDLIKWSEATTSVKKNYAQITANSASQHNITFTVADDGTVVANSGANTAQYSWSFALNPHLFLRAGTYILSDGDLGGSASTAYLQITTADETTEIANNTNSHQKTFTLATDQYVVLRIFYVQGATIDATFKPMIRLASIADATYEPYILDNVELNELKADKTQITNPNLLDNPWFTVNQRGQSNYNTNNTYSVDRWKIVGNEVISVSSSGLTIDNSNESTYWGALRNYFENDVIDMLRGKTVTASVMYSDGSIKSATGIVPTTDPSSNTNIAIIEYLNIQIGFRYFSSGTYKYCMSIDARPSASALTIRAVKLEVGSVSTLAMDTAPNYQQELAKCQRYYYRHRGAYEYVGYFNTSTNFRTNLTLPVPMRTIPSMKLPTPTDFAQCAIYDAQGNAVQPTAIAIDSVNNIVGQAELLINNTIPTHTVNMCGVQRFNLIMELSADL